MIIYEKTVTANGDVSDILTIESYQTTLQVTGTFGGGTLSMSVALPGKTTYRPVGSEGNFTSEATKALFLSPGSNVKFNLSGATSPSLVIGAVG